MNLILITVDCLRADHLGCMGYPKKITPNLDRLASAGVLFSQAISVSNWTPGSFIAILTSNYPLMYGGELRVTDRRITLAQILKANGYETAGFHSNPWLSSYYGYHKGFDTFDDSLQKNRYGKLVNGPKELVKRTVPTNSTLYSFLSRIYAALILTNPHYSAEVLNKKVLSWLQNKTSNFFLWVHYMDVHRPRLPSSRFTLLRKKEHILEIERKAANSPSTLSPQELNELINLYDMRIKHVDQEIGSLLRILRGKNILKNTAIIITADHGEQFLEHGVAFHGLHLYDELIHVPLIIAGPGLESQVIKQQVSLLDLSPTILDMLEIVKPNGFMGNSFLPIIVGNRIEAKESGVISESDVGDKRIAGRKARLDANERVISVRTGKWKYIYNEGEQHELYDFENDPKETRNLIDTEPEIAAALRAKIMAHIRFEEESSTTTEEERIKARITRLKGARNI